MADSLMSSDALDFLASTGGMPSGMDFSATNFDPANLDGVPSPGEDFFGGGAPMNGLPSDGAGFNFGDAFPSDNAAAAANGGNSGDANLAADSSLLFNAAIGGGDHTSDFFQQQPSEGSTAHPAPPPPSSPSPPAAGRTGAGTQEPNDEDDGASTGGAAESHPQDEIQTVVTNGPPATPKQPANVTPVRASKDENASTTHHQPHHPSTPFAHETPKRSQQAGEKSQHSYSADEQQKSSHSSQHKGGNGTTTPVPLRARDSNVVAPPASRRKPSNALIAAAHIGGGGASPSSAARKKETDLAAVDAFLLEMKGDAEAKSREEEEHAAHVQRAQQQDREMMAQVATIVAQRKTAVKRANVVNGRAAVAMLAAVEGLCGASTELTEAVANAAPKPGEGTTDETHLIDSIREADDLHATQVPALHLLPDAVEVTLRRLLAKE